MKTYLFLNWFFDILSYAEPSRSISMELIKKAKALKARRYRNRRLGDFLKELDLTEDRATGIPTIQDELRKNGSSLATIETDTDRTYFLINIPCRDGFVPEDEPINEPIITKRQRQIIQLINENPSISKLRLAAALSVAPVTIKRDVNYLTENSIIRHTGPNRGGYWKIIRSVTER